MPSATLGKAKTMELKKRRSPRRKFADFNELGAQAAIGHLDADSEIYGVTRGEISLIDIMGHVFTDTNSRDVVLATWTAAAGSIKQFSDMARSRAIRSLRLIVDPSFVTRKPEDCKFLHELFGSEAIRCAPLHAKFCIFSGGRVPVTLRTSMNLNPNTRIESYEISTCPEMASYHLRLVEEIYREFPIPLPGVWQSSSRKPLKALNPDGHQKYTPLF